MKNLNYSLINTDVIDNFEVFSKDSESKLLNGVVNRVYLTIALSDDSDISMPYSVMLDFPNQDTFLDIEDVTKAKVLKWAIDSISDNQKEMFYKSLLKRKNNTLPTTRKVEFK